jgi:NAD(P)-dependent dehydrogenase (short-subunit alcohol dehydrogenase family)
VANLVLFVASPLADFINGTNLRVDGGYMAAVTHLAMH